MTRSNGSLAVEKGDEEKMRTNIDQTNGMLTSSIALILTHNTSSSPQNLSSFLVQNPQNSKTIPKLSSLDIRVKRLL